MQTGRNVLLTALFLCVCDSPVKYEDDEDQHEGHQISEDPHQVILIRTLRDRQIKRVSYCLHVQVNKMVTNETSLETLHCEVSLLIITETMVTCLSRVSFIKCRKYRLMTKEERNEDNHMMSSNVTVASEYNLAI